MEQRYGLYVESGPKHRKTMVHVLDLLGCVAVGDTTEAALDATPDAITAYRAFLTRHGEEVDGAGFTTHVVEHITQGQWLGNGSPYLVFGPDLEPVSPAEIAVFLRRFDWLFEDLAAWNETQRAPQLDAKPGTGGRTARAVLLHALGSPGAYLSAALAGAPGFSRVATQAERGEITIAGAYRTVSSMAGELVRATTPSQRAGNRVLGDGARVYTLRKALRRMLEHTWEHTAELSRRPGGPSI